MGAKLSADFDRDFLSSGVCRLLGEANVRLHASIVAYCRSPASLAQNTCMLLPTISVAKTKMTKVVAESSEEYAYVSVLDRRLCKGVTD